LPRLKTAGVSSFLEQFKSGKSRRSGRLLPDLFIFFVYQV